MAVTNSKKLLVDLELLKYYNTQIQQWVQGKIDAIESPIIFMERINFPTIGKDKTLYVDDEKIYIYSTVKKTYVQINGGGSGGDSLQWLPFV